MPTTLKPPLSKIMILWVFILTAIIVTVLMKNLPTIIYTHALRFGFLHIYNLSNLLTASIYSYALGLIFAGVLIDWIENKILIISTLMMPISVFLLGHADALYILFMGAILNGISNGILSVGILKISSTYLPKKYFSIFLGLYMGFAYLLNATIPSIINAQIEQIGMFALTNAIVVGSFFLLFIIKIFSRIDSPKTTEKDVKKILGNPNLWITCFIAFITSFAANAPSLLLPYAGYYKWILNNASFFLMGGVIVSCPLAALFSQLIYERIRLLFLSLWVSAILLSVMTFYTTETNLTNLLYLFGCCVGFTTLLYLIINDISSSTNSGIAFSLLLLSLLSGQYLHPHYIDQNHHLTHLSINLLMTIPLTLFIGGLAALFLREKEWKTSKNEGQLHPLQCLILGIKGKLSLGFSFWIFYELGFIYCLILMAAFLFTMYVLFPTPPADGHVILENISCLLLLLIIAYRVLSIYIVWKCSNNWQHSVVWKYIARIYPIVSCGVLYFIACYLLTLWINYLDWVD
jgi:MFS family permease